MTHPFSLYTRSNPYLARIKERLTLTGAQSSKRTYHIVLDVEEGALPYKVGDSIGVIPTNDPKLVDQILHKMGCEDNASLREHLIHKANISKCSFHKLFPVEKTALPLLELVQHHKPNPDELCKVLLPLLPRFYSIASSAKVYEGEMHLLVAFVSFEQMGHTYFGVGSHFLCEGTKIEPIPIYVQPSNHFTLPDPNTPIIMIGPGTGVAPFRAFLQERIATQASGRNWLFFGERNRNSDFYYSDYFLELEKQGRLRLDTAFSRDQSEKIYVQHKMLENRKAIWQWIQDGASIFVCGDAHEMAKDVNLALQQIVHTEGKMNEEDALQFLKQLRGQKRYLLDVY